MPGGGGDRREDGESGTRVWERGVSACHGRARGDGVCRLCLRCLQTHKLVTRLPAGFLLVARLRLSSAQPRLQNLPGAGFTPLSCALLRQRAPAGAVQSWGYPQELQQLAELTQAKSARENPSKT